MFLTISIGNQVAQVFLNRKVRIKIPAIIRTLHIFHITVNKTKAGICSLATSPTAASGGFELTLHEANHILT